MSGTDAAASDKQRTALYTSAIAIALAGVTVPGDARSSISVGELLVCADGESERSSVRRLAPYHVRFSLGEPLM